MSRYFHRSTYVSKNNKLSSPGNDAIPLKQLGSCYIKPITYLTNWGFSRVHIPQRLENGQVLPIFEKGDSLLMEIYRPVVIFFSVKHKTWSVLSLFIHNMCIYVSEYEKHWMLHDSP